MIGPTYRTSSRQCNHRASGQFSSIAKKSISVAAVILFSLSYNETTSASVLLYEINVNQHTEKTVLNQKSPQQKFNLLRFFRQRTDFLTVETNTFAAQNNNSSIFQAGLNNYAEAAQNNNKSNTSSSIINQYGNLGFAKLFQNGDINYSSIDHADDSQNTQVRQQGFILASEISLSGFNNAVFSQQEGVGQLATTLQEGRGHSAFIEQIGQLNTLLIWQNDPGSSGSLAQVNQDGVGNNGLALQGIYGASQPSDIYIDQVGNAHNAWVGQYHGNNRARIKQEGWIGNQADIYQSQDSSATIMQFGQMNTALVDQGGNSRVQRAQLLQAGSGNTATVMQRGQGHNTNIRQQGQENEARIIQRSLEISANSKEGNYAFISQYGFNNYTNVEQIGNRNTVSVNQRAY
ncbi:MAG: hypothetical protein ACQEUK_15650 [Pseudomonadota bacterium]